MVLDSIHTQDIQITHLYVTHWPEEVSRGCGRGLERMDIRKSVCLYRDVYNALTC